MIWGIILDALAVTIFLIFLRDMRRNRGCLYKILSFLIATAAILYLFAASLRFFP